MKKQMLLTHKYADFCLFQRVVEIISNKNHLSTSARNLDQRLEWKLLKFVLILKQQLIMAFPMN
jgi:hypothetical protein